MNIPNKLTRAYLTLFAAAILFSAAGAGQAQIDSVEKKRVQSPATVRGFVGGESHDSYVVRARKNQELTVQISRQGSRDRWANFIVSTSADFYAGDLIKGGKETDNGKKWVGRVPSTGDYFVYVTAHPATRYQLRISTK